MEVLGRVSQTVCHYSDDGVSVPPSRDTHSDEVGMDIARYS